MSVNTKHPPRWGCSQSSRRLLLTFINTAQTRAVRCTERYWGLVNVSLILIHVHHMPYWIHLLLLLVFASHEGCDTAKQTQ